MAQLPEAPSAWRCDDCGKVCAEPLTAINPFDKHDKIYGCPHCKSCGVMEQACQHLGCTERPSSGTPGGNGYRYFWACHKHKPADKGAV